MTVNHKGVTGVARFCGVSGHGVSRAKCDLDVSDMAAVGICAKNF